MDSPENCHTRNNHRLEFDENPVEDYMNSRFDLLCIRALDSVEAMLNTRGGGSICWDKTFVIELNRMLLQRLNVRIDGLGVVRGQSLDMRVEIVGVCHSRSL